MRIAINALCQVGGGSKTYLHNMLPYLGKLDQKNEYFIFLPKYGNVLKLENFPNYKYISVNINSYNTLWRFLYEQIIIPFLLKKYEIDLLFSPVDTTSLLSLNKTVVAIRNLNPYESFNSYIPVSRKVKIKNIFLKLFSWLSVIKSKKIIFVSNYSKEIISKQLRIPEHKSKAVYHGINKKEFQSPYKKDIIKEIKDYKTYFLCVSTINPHKNYENLIKAYNLLDKRFSELPPLVIVGKVSNKNYLKNLIKLINDLGLSKKIIFLREIPYNQIYSVYKKALIFLFPSYLETFGHPLLEAMASRVPIVASNSTCIPEILGNAGVVFDPYNYREIAEKIEQVIKDNNIREELIKRGEKRIEDFSWEKTAKQTVAVFNKAYNSF